MDKIVCRIDERYSANMQLNRNFLPLSLDFFPSNNFNWMPMTMTTTLTTTTTTTTKLISIVNLLLEYQFSRNNYRSLNFIPTLDICWTQ